MTIDVALDRARKQSEALACLGEVVREAAGDAGYPVDGGASRPVQRIEQLVPFGRPPESTFADIIIHGDDHPTLRGGAQRPSCAAAQVER